MRVSGEHVYWPAGVSLLDDAVLAAHATLTQRQLTDVYLLALAVRHGGCLATFDTSIPLSVVRGATKKHMVTLEVDARHQTNANVTTLVPTAG